MLLIVLLIDCLYRYFNCWYILHRRLIYNEFCMLNFNIFMKNNFKKYELEIDFLSM